MKQPYIKFLGHTISYAVFIVLIIVSSFLFAEQFQENDLIDLKTISNRTSDILNKTIEKYKNATDCVLYPVDNLVFRANTPTGIDIAITVFVVGKELFK